MFSSLPFLFLFLSATTFMYYEENMSLNFRNTTCSANHIDTWNQPSRLYFYMFLVRRGHEVYICQISCINAIIQYFFFVLAKKQNLWNALSLLPDDLVKCSFHGFPMLEFVYERNITDSGRKHNLISLIYVFFFFVFVADNNEEMNILF